VRVPMVFVYIAYWGIALPVGYWLAFRAGWEARGIWTGLVVGLACTAISVVTRFCIMSKRPVKALTPEPVLAPDLA